jgi:hypothetical protein
MTVRCEAGPLARSRPPAGFGLFFARTAGAGAPARTRGSAPHYLNGAARLCVKS